MMEAYDHVFALWQQSEGIGVTTDYDATIQAYLNRNPGMSFVQQPMVP